MAVKKKARSSKTTRTSVKKKRTVAAKSRTRKKSASKTKTSKRPSVKRKIQKGSARASTKDTAARISSKSEMIVEPGPASVVVPPVEEPSMHEEAIGIVTHYYSHLGVAVVQINKSVLKTGDTVHVLGHTTDITQTIESMEYEHHHVDQADAGQSVGIKITGHAREHDIVYLVK